MSSSDLRSFPIVYARRWADTVEFYEHLGFTRTFELGEYATLERGSAQLGVVSGSWPNDHYGMRMGDGPRFELFVYVDDVNATFDALRAASVPVIKEPELMPWGETVGFVTDPEGNPVALAQS